MTEGLVWIFRSCVTGVFFYIRSNFFFQLLALTDGRVYFCFLSPDRTCVVDVLTASAVLVGRHLVLIRIYASNVRK